MRIVILASRFPPKRLAGTEIATCNLAEHLAKRGHEVHVVTSLDEGLPEESFEKGFYVHRLPRIEICLAGASVFCAEIVRTIQKINPDIIHVQGLGIAVPALISKRLLKIPYAVWGQGSDVYLPNQFVKLTSKVVIKNADSVIALTENMREELLKICDRRISVVPNGINIEKFKSPTGIRKKENEKTIIFVGRLHPVKGVKYLIEAMATVHKKMPNIRLVIVGDGIERLKLGELTKKLDLNDSVKFVGQVPQERVFENMNQADIFVLPSLSEGFPVVLLEAMATGLPIIATNVRGIPDIVENGVNGYLVNIKNPSEIADRIIMLIQDNIMRKEISVNNRVKAELFAWDKVAKMIEEEYQLAVP